jgi:hypothetical protein
MPLQTSTSTHSFSSAITLVDASSNNPQPQPPTPNSGMADYLALHAHGSLHLDRLTPYSPGIHHEFNRTYEDMEEDKYLLMDAVAERPDAEAEFARWNNGAIDSEEFVTGMLRRIARLEKSMAFA